MEYLIKSTAILTLFYVFYKLFLQSETFFQSIRAYFLIGIITAFALPLLIIPQYIEIEALNFEGIPFTDVVIATTQGNTFNWIQLAIYSYLLGVLFFSLRFFTQFISLLWFLYTHEKVEKGNYIFIQTKKNIAPFSFFNYIIYNDALFNEKELTQILIHEKVHVNHLHSLDVFLSQCMIILNWFNPLIWLYSKEVQKNLEFIADEHAQNFNNEKKNYQYLLLKTISPNYKMALTTNFYNSLTKKRINMLQKNRSNKTMYFKFALIIPILIAFIFTFNTKVIAQQKKMKLIEVHENMEIDIISKNFTKNDLETLKNTLAEKGITLKYKKLKYNAANEIISISISVENEKGNQASLSQNGTEAIQAIQIKVNMETGVISLGNMTHGIHSENSYFFSDNDGEHKTIIIKSDGDEDITWVSSDSTKVMDIKKEFLFISDENEIHSGDKKKHHTKVWISKGGKHTGTEKMEIHEVNKINSKHNNAYIIKMDDEGSGMQKHKKIMVIDSDGEEPLIIKDGEELKGGSMKDIDTNSIEKIEILKGEKAVEKYGEKAKDGVILITTKK